MFASLLKKTGLACIYCAIIVVFLFAIIITLARSANPIAQQLSDEFKQALENALSLPIKLETFEISWSDGNPIIWFNQVELGEKQNKLTATRIITSVDLIDSLIEQKIVFNKILLEGMVLRFNYISPAKTIKKEVKANTQKIATQNKQPLIRWLSSIQKLQIKNSILELNHNGTQSVFTNINLDINNTNNKHQLKLTILLPKTIGHKLEVILDAKGNKTHARDWVGKIYFEANNLNLAWLSKEFKEVPVHFFKGKSSFKIWTDWKNGEIKRLHVKTLNKDLVLKVKDKTIKADQLDSNFGLIHQNDNWIFKTNNIYFRQANNSWKTGQIFLNYQNISGNITGFIEQVKLGILRQKLSDSSLNLSGVPKIDGTLNHVYFHYNIKQKKPQYRFFTELKQIDIAKSDNYPGFKGFSGKVAAQNQSIYLLSHSSNSIFYSQGTFRQPLNISTLKGVLQFSVDDLWQVKTDSMYLQTPDLTAHLQLKVSNTTSNEADVNVNAKIINVKSEKVNQYLPVSIMTTDLIAWLDRSIKTGYVPETYFLMRGNMRDFPFTNKKGVFDIGFTAQNLTLDYLENWPKLTKIHADVRFFENKMRINSHQATINQVKFKDLNVVIDDLYRPYLTVKGKGKGAFKQYKRFIKKSPLNDTLGLFVDQFHFSGKAKISLDMLFDIDGDNNPKIKGTLSLNNAKLSSTYMDLKLNNIMGDIGFTENDILATNIKLKVLEEKWILKAYTRKNIKAQATATRIFLKGMLDPKKVINQYLGYENLDSIGKSLWRVNIDIPVTDKLTPVVSLDFKSHLKGTKLNYPAPFNKKAQAKKPFKITLKLPDDENHAYVSINFDGLLQSKQRWKVNNNWVLDQSSTLINNIDSEKTDISLDNTSKQQLKVKLKKLNIDRWKQQFSNNKSSSSLSVHQLFNIANIQLLDSIFNNKKVKQLTIDLVEKKHHYQYKIQSDFVSGKIRVPKKLNKETVVDLDFLKTSYLTSSSNSQTKWLLSEVPEVGLGIKKLYIADFVVNNLQLQTQRIKNAIKIKKLGFDNAHMSLTSYGRWWGKDDDNTQTNLQFLIKTDDLGKAISNFNFSNTFESGKGQLKGDLTWPGSLMDATLTGLNGHFELKLENGKLKDIEPGVGRIFGLFSLQALPKRLLLDFSDVLGTGLEYESINGNFKITNGDAFTHNLTMKSTIGNVLVTGKTGLASKDYNQKLSFIPAVFTNLPVVGAMAAGPQVGFTVLIIEAFLKSIGADISAASAIKYKLTGTWDNPKMELDN